jgi:hypothetical protein
MKDIQWMVHWLVLVHCDPLEDFIFFVVVTRFLCSFWMDVVCKPQGGGVLKLRGPRMSMIKSTMGMPS